MNALSIVDLATLCEEETRKFYLGSIYNPLHCYELLKRALSDQSAEAFSHVYRIYEPMVTRWVYRCGAFSSADEPADFFVSAAFSSFYFALRGKDLGKFDSLSKVLNYLKSCVYTAVLEYIRKNKRHDIVTEASIETYVNLGTEDSVDSLLQDLWARICELLPDKEDQQLAYHVFVLDMKPSEIAESDPERWESARQVTQRLYRIRQILRNDSDLRHLGED